MTYCVLVEDAFARPVPYGILQYSDARGRIPFTADRKREVLQLADYNERLGETSMNWTRRESIAVLGGTALAMKLPQWMRGAEAPPIFHAVDHVRITVSDPKKAAEFYGQLFGGTVYKEAASEKRYVKVGPCYLSLSSPGSNQPAEYRVDHICPGVEPYDLRALERYLNSANVKFRHFDDTGAFIGDPENPGVSILRWTWNSWSASIKTSAPDTLNLSKTPLFNASGTDHILLQVINPEKSVLFYEKLFGLAVQKAENRIWFQVGASRIGLSKTAPGGRSGVDHVCVLVSAFNRETAVRSLEQAGAKVQAVQSATSIEFRDPDGVSMQVMSRA